MDILSFNTYWMAINIFLAAIAVIFGWLAYDVRQKFLKALFIVIWLFFLPNTLYILTDLIHLPRLWPEVEGAGKLVLIFQFLILEVTGLVSFTMAIKPFEKMLLISRLAKNKWLITTLIVGLNFLVGFGIVLGRVPRLNSWEVLTDTGKVVSGSLNVISSPDLLLLTFIFGVVGNLAYFLIKEGLAI